MDESKWYVTASQGQLFYCVSTMYIVRLNHPCPGRHTERCEWQPELARQQPSESHFYKCQLSGGLLIVLSGERGGAETNQLLYFAARGEE